ncbi:MAG TPA: serine/threonine-protein kinase, partial [Gemmatales bacterium]|nr:serine/threonine-protein kinase [Gemmatales bacterium]
MSSSHDSHFDWLGQAFTASDVQRSPAMDPNRTQATHGATEPFADRNGPTTCDLGAAETTAGPVLPGFEMLVELGRGGMGVVYQARQTALGRRVAVKLLRGDAHRDPAALQRFRNEAAALARLQHPHIVQIHEVGEQAGQAFCVLEWVNGGSLDRWLRGRPQPARQAAGLVLTLARAVEAAHEVGILHRDLKPANILLGFAGPKVPDWSPTDPLPLQSCQPKISDFGLAKDLAGESPSQTESGVVIGTPHYMAPEQAQGRNKELGPTVDVYALGAILYELLTGRPPFQGVTSSEVLLLVLTAEPIAPRRLQPGVPRDLETICLKCLHKDACRRYGSAAALAADLGRFLNHEPIVARPASPVERLLKWSRRRPALAATILAGLIGVVGVVAATGLLAMAWRGEADARLLAQRERDEAQKQQRQAQENFALAYQAIDQTSRVIVENPRLQAADFTDLRRELLATCVPFFTRFVAMKSDSLELQGQRAVAYRSLAALYIGLDDLALAEQAALESLRTWQALVAQPPADERFRRGLAGTWQNLSMIQGRLGRQADSRASIAKAMAIWDEILRVQPGDEEARRIRAVLDYNLAIGFAATRETARSVEHFRLAIARLDEFLCDQPQDRAATHELASALINLAAQLRTQRAEAEAGPLLLRADALSRSLVEADPANVSYLQLRGQALANLAQWHAAAGREGEMLRLFKEVVELWRRVVLQQPSHPGNHVELAKLRRDLALLLDAAGQEEAALQALRVGREALAAAAVAFPGRRPAFLDVEAAYWMAEANLRCHKDDVSTQRHALDQAAQALRQGLAVKPPAELALPMRNALIMALLHRATSHEQAAEGEASERLFDEALVETESLVALAPQDLEAKVLLGGQLCNKGNRHYSRREMEAALTAYDRSVQTLEPVATSHPDQPHALEFLLNAARPRAELLLAAKEYAAAEAACELVLRFNTDTSRELRFLVWRAEARVPQGDAQAWKPIEKWLSVPNLPGLAYFDLARIHVLAAALAQRDDERDERLRQALRLLSTEQGTGH